MTDGPFRFALDTGNDPEESARCLGFLNATARNGTQDQLPPEYVGNYLANPDERVVARAIEVFQSRVLQAGRVTHAALDRAVQDALAEGHLWTRGLDVLSPVLAPESYGPPSHRELVERLHAWVSSTDDHELLLRLLLEFRGRTVHQAVAQYARCLTIQHVRALALVGGRGDQDLRSALRHNKHLPADVRLHLARSVVDETLVVPGGGYHWKDLLLENQTLVAEGAPDVFGRLADMGLAEWRRGPMSLWDPEPLILKCGHCPPEVWARYVEARLEEWAARGVRASEGAAFLVHPATTDATRQAVWGLIREAQQLHLLTWNVGNATPESTDATALGRLLDTVLADCLSGDDVTNNVVRIPGLSEDALHQILAVGDLQTIRQHLLAGATAVQYPAACYCLLDSEDKDLLAKVVQADSIPEWARLRALRKLLRKYPAGASDFLVRVAHHFPEGIPSEIFEGALRGRNPAAMDEVLKALAHPVVTADRALPSAPPRPKIAREAGARLAVHPLVRTRQRRRRP